MKTRNIISSLFILVTSSNIDTTNGFVYKSKFGYKRQILKSIEIDNDHPSFIAKTLQQEFHKFGIPQSYDDFLGQLKQKQIESVKNKSKKNKPVKKAKKSKSNKSNKPKK